MRRALIAVAFIALYSLALAAGDGGDSRPLAGPTDSVRAFIDDESFRWQVTSTPHFEVYVEQGSYASERLDEVRAGAEGAVARALAVLGEPAYERRGRLFILSSRDRMSEIIGARYKGFTMADHDAVALVFSEDVRPYFDHEIMHLVSINLWGEPSPWIREGSAVYADGSCLGYEDPFDTLSAYFMREDMLFSLESLVNEFEECARDNDLIAYLQAASLFAYLYETHGLELVRALWQSDTAAVERVVGAPLSEIERDWRRHLSQAPLRQTVDWEELMDKGCG